MRRLIIILLCLPSVFLGCKKNKKLKPSCDGSNPKYNSEIKSIINASCLGSGCHSGGSGNGDFTSYSGLKPYLDNGKFNKTVITDQTMPQGSDLTQEQINKIQCWVNNNYPEN